QPQIQSQANRSPPSDGDDKRKRGLIVGAGVVVAAIVVGAFVFLDKGKQTTPTPPAQPKVAATRTAPGTAPGTARQAAAEADVAKPAAETSLIKGKVDELLEKAPLAMRERRYSEPIGDNALLYYRSAAAADPSNGEAADGLQRVAGVLASRFEDAVNGGRFDEAGMALANLKAAAPNDNRIPTLENR